MYEETKSSIDWKGLFLKVLIIFLIVLIGVKGYSILKGNDSKKEETSTTQVVSDQKNNTTFTENLEKLREAGKTYFDKNKNKLPSTEDNNTMITLNELIDEGYITTLSDSEGKICDGNSSYVSAFIENGESKLKANLVCNNTMNNSIGYLGENDSGKESNATNYTYSSNSNSNNYNNSTKGNSSSGSAQGISVSTSTNVSQNVSFNTNKDSTCNDCSNSSNTRYYTVTFDSNGGNLHYDSKRVRYYNTVAYPGANQKNGYTFIGWYLDGAKYDFSTPVTENITLIAMYSRNTYYNDSYYNDNYNNYDNYYDYYDRQLVTRTTTSTVYSMAWDEKGTHQLRVNHTLRLPDKLNSRDIEKVRIKKIEYSGPINTKTRANTYMNNHANTFIYEPNGWEYPTNSSSTLATINSNAVIFYYNTGYKTLYDAEYNGFNVSWQTSSVAKQCSSTFSVNDVANLCNYGIYYKVTWEYQIYE